MIGRGAAGRRILHSRVFEGETIYFMEQVSKKISAVAKVIQVLDFVKLTDEQILETLDAYQKALA